MPKNGTMKPPTCGTSRGDTFEDQEVLASNEVNSGTKMGDTEVEIHRKDVARVSHSALNTGTAAQNKTKHTTICYFGLTPR